VTLYSQLFADLFPVNNRSLFVWRISKRSAAVGADEFVDLIVEQRFIMIDIGQLLGQWACVGRKYSGELLFASDSQDFVLHEVHAGNVLARIQFLCGAHHEGMQYLIQSFRQIVVAVKELSSAYGISNILILFLTVWDPRRTPETQRQPRVLI